MDEIKSPQQIIQEAINKANGEADRDDYQTDEARILLHIRNLLVVIASAVLVK